MCLARRKGSGRRRFRGRSRKHLPSKCLHCYATGPSLRQRRLRPLLPRKRFHSSWQPCAPLPRWARRRVRGRGERLPWPAPCGSARQTTTTAWSSRVLKVRSGLGHRVDESNVAVGCGLRASYQSWLGWRRRELDAREHGCGREERDNETLQSRGKSGRTGRRQTTLMQATTIDEGAT